MKWWLIFWCFFILGCFSPSQEKKGVDKSFIFENPKLEYKDSLNCESYFDYYVNKKIYIKFSNSSKFLEFGKEFLLLFYNKFNYPDTNTYQGTVILELFVNNRGELFDAKIYKKNLGDYTIVEERVLETVNGLEIKWPRPHCNMEFIDVKIPYVIRF